MLILSLVYGIQANLMPISCQQEGEEDHWPMAPIIWCLLEYHENMCLMKLTTQMKHQRIYVNETEH